MAGTSLLTLIYDIAAILDDVALMTKVAAKKTAGVLGDDLALNAQQVAGVNADRELPVVWAVAKGSIKNKLILVPLALAISAFIPWLVRPLLMIGGAFLCYEGFEKLVHKIIHKNTKDEDIHSAAIQAMADTKVDMVSFEKDKISGAIRTDFILSAEIIVIALGSITGASLYMQIIVLSGIALIMTVGIYGLVAGIVKLDDAGLYLTRGSGTNIYNKIQHSVGVSLLYASPCLMKILSVAGTAAMFIVGGEILTHNFINTHDISHNLIHPISSVPMVVGILGWFLPLILNAILGILAGAVVLSVVLAIGKIRKML